MILLSVWPYVLVVCLALCFSCLFGYKFQLFVGLCFSFLFGHMFQLSVFFSAVFLASSKSKKKMLQKLCWKRYVYTFNLDFKIQRINMDLFCKHFN